jgi:metallophosphoesterase (TIGR03768 family)
MMNIDNPFKAFRFTHLLSLLTLLFLPVYGNGADAPLPQPTTRQQTIHPVAVPAESPHIPPSQVDKYGVYGYSAWQTGPGEDVGRRLDLMPTGYKRAPNATRLLSFFAMSDIHITDKESPAQAFYIGWSAAFGAGATPFSSAYSPVILSTTHVLDAAIRAVNTLHRKTPFDFGIFLGDAVNNGQYNELRWYIDVIDGKYITPSSGAHRGADTIDYQKPYQAAGLDPSIPWYQNIGNHDQFWSGVNYPNEKIMKALIGSEIMNTGADPADSNSVNLKGAFMGVVDGTTSYGLIVGAGLTEEFQTTPTVVADLNRHALATTSSASLDWMKEFFNSTSSPKGHGFTQSNLDDDFACYTFEPKADLPLKVIVLDDTAKLNIPSVGQEYYAKGAIDQKRFDWLVNELQKGQDAGQLMIVATHIPINPQRGLFNAIKVKLFAAFPFSLKTDEELIATLHNYPNLILLIAGHAHRNVVTPQPSPDPAHPENGFWEVETPSLRDFPQQFRTFDIRRNSDNTVSIVATSVDPASAEGSPAAKSRGYTIGAFRVFSGIPTLNDTTSRVYNVELVKQLTPAMQTKIAPSGSPLGPAGWENRTWLGYW